MFYENSTRTRVSFEVAGKWISADIINVSAYGSSVGKGESLRDTALTLAADGSRRGRRAPPGVRAPPHRLAELGRTGRVVNAGDGTHEHPTQALLDASTLRGRLGADLTGRRVAVVGDVLHSRVARSNVLLLATLGAEVTLVAPPTLLPGGVEAWPADRDLRPRRDLATGPDAVMMLRVQAERMNGGFFPSAREYAVRFGLSRRRAWHAARPRGRPAPRPDARHGDRELRSRTAPAPPSSSRSPPGSTCGWPCSTGCSAGEDVA